MNWIKIPAGLAGFLVIAVFLLCSPLSSSGDDDASYSDLPEGHWAREAVNFLLDAEILEGYPGSYFRGDDALTRYELAIALYEITKWIAENREGDLPADVAAVMGALEAEFIGDLAEIERVSLENAGSIEDLRGELVEMGERMDALEHKIGGVTWRGVAGFLVWYLETDDGRKKRFSEFLLVKLAFDAPITDNLDFHGRLASATGGFATVQIMGNYLRNYQFNIDRAYVEYSAPWIPVENDLYFGRFKNILMWNAPVGLIWDSDYNFDGTGQHFEFEAWNQDFEFNAVQAILNEKAEALVEDDEWVIAWQLGAHDFVTEGLAWYATYYHWQNIVGGGNHFRFDGYKGNVAGGGVDVNLDGEIDNLDSIAQKYNILNIGANYTFNAGKSGRPILVHGEFVKNLDPAIAQGVGSRLGLGGGDNRGWSLGFKYGSARAAGEWDAGYYYKSIGATATVGNFADGFDYGTNIDLHSAYFNYKPAGNTVLAFRWILHNLKNDFGYLERDRRNTVLASVVVFF